MDKNKVDAIFGRRQLTRFSAHTPTTTAELHAALHRARKSGIAWSNGFFEPSIGSAAVPVLDFAGTPVAALNVSGPLEAFHNKAGRKQIEAELRAAGAELSQSLGWIDSSGKKQGSSKSRHERRPG
jgi:DNA-binding IclR family transcriptional regulator